MLQNALEFYRTLFEELDTVKLQQEFLKSLLSFQNVERGSLWVKKGKKYTCVEAQGPQSEKVAGLSLDAEISSVIGWVIENGKMTIAEPGKDERHYSEIELGLETKSKLILSYPLVLKNGKVYGAVQLIDTSAAGDQLNLDTKYLKLLELTVAIGSIALSNSLAYGDQVKENDRLKRTLDEIRSENQIIGQSPPILKVLKNARDYAQTDFPVLITGESGTGKELIAYELHRLSRRCDKPFLVQNCSAIPETLLESELFGYKKGAFTGAHKDKTGLFEDASGGTVFLDEIGDMPLSLQARILRVIQSNEIKPLGGTATKKVDVRILSATNKDLTAAIAANEFREDLFYRLNVLPLHLPPLRERPEDIPLLLRYFLRRESKRMGMQSKRFSNKALLMLTEHPWRGNIREMENLVKYIMTTVDGPIIEYKDLPWHILGTEPLADTRPEEEESSMERQPNASLPPEDFSLASFTWDELEKQYILDLLEKNRWNVTKAAKQAAVNRSTFDSRMKRLGIRKN